MLTQQHLKEILHYDPITGVLTWNASQSGRKAKVGWLHNQGYIRVKIEGKSYYAHQLAWLYMTGDFIEKIDHIDNSFEGKSNNRWSNLREATGNGNEQNRAPTRSNTSGYKGVAWNKELQKWRARIQANLKDYFLGYFDTKEEAARAYNEAAEKYHGKFAHLNEVQ